MSLLDDPHLRRLIHIIATTVTTHIIATIRTAIIRTAIIAIIRTALTDTALTAPIATRGGAAGGRLDVDGVTLTSPRWTAQPNLWSMHLASI